MAQQFLNTGTTANDTTGDRLRPAGMKIDANFSEVYQRLSVLEQNPGSGGGTGGGAINYQATGSGAIVRPLAAKLGDLVAVEDYGADPSGVADSTTAFANALGTGRSLLVRGDYKITAGLSFAAARQKIWGLGNARIRPAGAFDVFTAGGGLESCGLVGVDVDAAGMTGGHVVRCDFSSRFVLRDMVCWSPWNFAWVQRSQFVTFSNVVVTPVRGAYGATLFGDNGTGRTDVVRLEDVFFGGTSGHKPDGLVVNGAVNTVSLRGAALVDVDRGLWVHNAANATLLPAFVVASDLQVVRPARDAVRLEVGAHYWFSSLYAHASVAGSGVYIGASVAEDTVALDPVGKITNHARYGVENNNRRFRGGTPFMAGNTLGDVQDAEAAVLRSPRHEIDAAAYFSFNGGNPAISFDVNDYLFFTRGTNAFGLTIGGTQVLGADGAKVSALVPFGLRGYALASLPAAASNAGLTVRVTDRDNAIATSDGTIWRWSTGASTATSPLTGSATATTLDGLSDVVISAPATGQTIRYNGTNFVNTALTTADISDFTAQVVTPGYRAPIDTFATAYTAVQNDANRVKRCTAATDVTVTLGALQTGTTIRFTQGAAGRVTFTAGSGVTLENLGTVFRSAGPGANVIATLMGTVWNLDGGLAA